MRNRHAGSTQPTNTPDLIHVEEFKTADFAVTAVYQGGRHWKRLRPRHSNEPAFWVEFNADGLYGPVSQSVEKWLDSVWKKSDEFPKVLRFPRRDEEGERLIANLAKAHVRGDAGLMLTYIDQIRRRIPAQGIDDPVADSSAWAGLPRFDPSKITKTEWLIQDFIAEGNLQLVFGEPGSFKSTLFLMCARTVSTGEEFLGMKTQKRRVIYLDFENPSNVIKARNDSLRLGLPDNPNLVIWDRFNNQPPPRPGDSILELVVRQCVRETGHGPWIIFDSWSSLLRGGEGGESTGQIAPIYMELRRLCDLGATITILDHAKKYEPATIYGGADKEAKADSIHNLLRHDNPLHPQNAIVRVESWLKRSAPKGTGAFAFEVQTKKDKNGDWQVVALIPAKDPVQEAKRRKRELLRDLIRLNPDAGQEALAKLAANKGMSRDEAIELLKSGIEKYWTRKKIAHGKYIYKLLKP